MGYLYTAADQDQNTPKKPQIFKNTRVISDMMTVILAIALCVCTWLNIELGLSVCGMIKYSSATIEGMSFKVQRELLAITHPCQHQLMLP